MPVDPHAAIEVSAFHWVPLFARGHVRDLRVRWALEEAGLAYRERLLDARQAASCDYLLEQPFGQVPSYRDDTVQLFESGAIVLHIGAQSDALLPPDPAGRARATAWVIAALNSIEPMILELTQIDVFCAGAKWARLRRPEAEQNIRQRLRRLSDWLGERSYLEDRFTAGDLVMTAVLRNLAYTTLIDEFPNLAAYQARNLARPAFARALSAQLAAFTDDGLAQAS